MIIMVISNRLPCKGCLKMDDYTEFLLDRIFEIRESYMSGDLGSKDYYQNVVGELIGALSQYTVKMVDSGLVS